MHTQWCPIDDFWRNPKHRYYDVMCVPALGVAQCTRVAPIVPLLPKASDNVNEIVQLMHLLSRDVTDTIDQLKTNTTNKLGRKKKKTTTEHDVKICCFRGCSNVVNQRDIGTQCAPSVDATWPKVTYSASSETGEHDDISQSSQISFFHETENFHRHNYLV